MNTARRTLLPALALVSFLLCSCGKGKPATVSPTPAPEPTAAPSTVRFEDVTKESGVAFVHENGAAGKKWMPETMGSGVAAFDADGDGKPDLLFVNGKSWDGKASGAAGAKGPQTLSFWKNATPPGGPLRFVDATREAGLAVSLVGMGVAVGDVDGDGAADLFVTGVNGNRLFLNDGRGRFRDATKGSGVEATGWGSSAAFGDFDGDGVLDLFVGRYVDWTPKTDLHCTLDGKTKSYCTPERYPGVTSQLFKGLGGGKFRDVTKAAGVENPLGKALGVAVRDVDGDGRPDIFVANDTAPNNLFHNVRTVDGVPLFTDVAIETGVAVGEDGRARGAMGAAFGDTKGDGGVSLAVGNFSNEMWSFWSAGPKGDFFADESVTSGLGRTSLLPLTFGVQFADLDLDGVLDLVGVNGHVETSVQDVQPTVTYRQPMLVFRGMGAGRFADVSGQAGESIAKPVVGRGLAVADLDGDGLPDLVVTENGGPARILQNTTKTPNRAVELVLRGAATNTGALGARVTSVHGAKRRIDEVSGGDGYLSASDRVVRVGLGTAPKLDEATVRWPAGGTSTARGLAPGRYLWAEGKDPVPAGR